MTRATKRIWCHGCYRVLPTEHFETGARTCRDCAADVGRFVLAERPTETNERRPRVPSPRGERRFRSAELAAVARARRSGVPIEDVDYDAILERDGYVCHICKGPVEPSELRFDHVVSHARGGPHAPENVGVAHALCGLRRSVRSRDIGE